MKRVFGYLNGRFNGLAKNTSRIVTLFGLANLYQVPRLLMPDTAKLHPLFG